MNLPDVMYVSAYFKYEGRTQLQEEGIVGISVDYSSSSYIALVSRNQGEPSSVIKKIQELNGVVLCENIYNGIRFYSIAYKTPSGRVIFDDTVFPSRNINDTIRLTDDMIIVIRRETYRVVEDFRASANQHVAVQCPLGCLLKVSFTQDNDHLFIHYEFGFDNEADHMEWMLRK